MLPWGCGCFRPRNWAWRGSRCGFRPLIEWGGWGSRIGAVSGARGVLEPIYLREPHITVGKKIDDR